MQKFNQNLTFLFLFFLYFCLEVVAQTEPLANTVMPPTETQLVPLETQLIAPMPPPQETTTVAEPVIAEPVIIEAPQATTEPPETTFTEPPQEPTTFDIQSTTTESEIQRPVTLEEAHIETETTSTEKTLGTPAPPAELLEAFTINAPTQTQTGTLEIASESAETQLARFGTKARSGDCSVYSKEKTGGLDASPFELCCQAFKQNRGCE